MKSKCSPIKNRPAKPGARRVAAPTTGSDVPDYAHGFGGINTDSEIHEKIQILSSDRLLSAETTLSLLTKKLADEYRSGGSRWLPDHMQKHSNIRAAILRVRHYLCNEAERMTVKNPNDKVSGGGPVTHESKQAANPPFAAPLG